MEIIHKCPSCGAEIIVEDTLSKEEYDNKIILEKFGYCSQCEDTYYWHEEYEYKKAYDFVKDY